MMEDPRVIDMNRKIDRIKQLYDGGGGVQQPSAISTRLVGLPPPAGFACDTGGISGRGLVSVASHVFLSIVYDHGSRKQAHSSRLECFLI